MRYVAEIADKRQVAITCHPGWLRRLLGGRTRTVYLQVGQTNSGWPIWIMPSGREPSRGMLDAIDELKITHKLSD